jgi:hypothetical protein
MQIVGHNNKNRDLHKMKEIYILFILILILASSCKDIPEKKPDSLYRLRIPNTSKVIYQYQYSSSMAFGSGVLGRTILDSTDGFSNKPVGDFPNYFILKFIDSKNIEMSVLNYELEYNKLDLKPYRTFTKKIEGLKFKISEYKPMEGGLCCGLREFCANSFKETSDSLFLLKVKDKSGKKNYSTVAYPKGNIKIVDSCGIVKRIEIEELIIGHRDAYRSDNPLKIVPNEPTVCISTNYYYLDSLTLVTQFSDYGIYKRIK